MAIKNRTTELLYNLMLTADSDRISKLAIKQLNAIQSNRASEQLLGLAAAFICLLDVYGLNAADVLGVAHNMVYDTSNSTTTKDYKGIKQFMKTEWNF